MIDIDQDHATPGPPWLKWLTAERDQCLGVYARVVRPGTLSLDKPVTVL